MKSSRDQSKKNKGSRNKRRKRKNKKTIKQRKWQKNRKFRIRKKKQQSLKKRLRNWFLKGFTSGFISLERKCQVHKWWT